MEKMWSYTNYTPSVTGQDQKGLLEKRDIQMSEEEFALFWASLVHQDDDRHIVLEDGQAPEGDTKVLREKANTAQSQ